MEMSAFWLKRKNETFTTTTMRKINSKTYEKIYIHTKLMNIYVQFFSLLFILTYNFPSLTDNLFISSISKSTNFYDNSVNKYKNVNDEWHLLNFYSSLKNVYLGNIFWEVKKIYIFFTNHPKTPIQPPPFSNIYLS